jgi:hypothetical protein
MIAYKLRDTGKEVKAAMFGGPEPLSNSVYKTCGGWILRNRNGIQRFNKDDWVVDIDGYVFILPSPIFHQLFIKVA